VDVAISSDDISVLDMAIERLPPGWRSVDGVDPQRCYAITRSDGPGFAISIDDEAPIRFETREAMLEFLEGDIQIFVAEFATPHLFVHAGVVAWNGKAIMLPGRSFSGKSTLVTSLVQAGATYYSDEYAVLDHDGRVLPYPRRVSLRTGPHGPTGRLDLTHLAPSGEDASTPIPVGLVALLRYEDGAAWDVETLDTLPAIMAMSEQTVAIQRRSADTLAILGKVTDNAFVIQGMRGEVDETVQRLLSMELVRGW